MQDSLDFSAYFGNIFEFSNELFENSNTPESQETDLYEEITQDRKTVYHCTFHDCGKIFQYKSVILRHVVIHQNQRPYCCKFKGCRKTFKRPDALNGHMQTHVANRPQSCKFSSCNRMSSTEDASRRHQISYNYDSPSFDEQFLTMSNNKPCQKVFKQDSPCVKFIKQGPIESALDKSKGVDDHKIVALESNLKLLDNTNEMGSQSYENKGLKKTIKEQFEALKYIFTENIKLREMLQEKERIILEERQKYRSTLLSQTQLSETQDSISHSDYTDRKLYEFLTEGSDGNLKNTLVD